MKWISATLMVILVAAVLPSAGAGAQEIGGNYNGTVCDLYNGLIVKSGAEWVRAFVNVPRNYLAFDDSQHVASGVLEGNIKQTPDADSGRTDILANDAVSKLMQMHNLKVAGQPVKVILSLKLDFKYKWDSSYPASGVPDPGSLASGYWISAITELLEANNLGAYVDVLVLGNEPMFETRPEQADKYATFLSSLIDAVHAERQSSGRSYQIFVGALNKAATHPNDAILKAVMQAASNPKVDGVDLHLHVGSVAEAGSDLAFVRSAFALQGLSKKIISTEFSLLDLWNAHAEDELESWGPRNGYPADMHLYEWLNTLMRQAAAGTPIGYERFASYFLEQAWYPRGWFRAFLETFSQYDVEVATYGLSAPPMVDAAGSSCATHAKLHISPDPSKSSKLWVIDFVYNGALLGLCSNGFYTPNPLVYPDFANALQTPDQESAELADCTASDGPNDSERLEARFTG
jgi:hypothetical protein